MKNYYFSLGLSFLLLFLSNENFAQCLSVSGNGIHVVQKGETLYSLSRKYDCSVSDICEWNGIRKSDVLVVCQELKVSEATSANNLRLVPKSASFESRMPKGASSGNTNTKQASLKHTVRRGETVASLAKLYGYTEERFREFNGLASDEAIRIGQQLTSTECECALNKRRAQQQSEPSEEEAIPINYDMVDVTEKSISPKPKSESGSSSTYSYMQQTELDMVNEINLVRSNPAGYVQYIQEYITQLRTRERYGTAVQSANELINELKETATLSKLTPVECLYKAAKKHGEDRLKAGSSSHTGTDGSMPWDRVTDACSEMSDGNENLVGGPDNVREAVILLLVDDGISSRGHRRTLLNPQWNYVACYKIGQLGYMPNSWVQKFGK